MNLSKVRTVAKIIAAGEALFSIDKEFLSGESAESVRMSELYVQCRAALDEMIEISVKMLQENGNE